MKKIKLLIPVLTSLTLASSIVNLTSCGKNYRANYSLLVQYSVDQLVELNKNPRCTSDGIRSNLDGARKYLTQQAVALGLNKDDVITDDYGNLWFDVPATSGCESYEPLILQGHMDMVIAGVDKDKKATTTIDTDVDWKNALVHSRDYKTSLGADDGIGLTIALALLNDKSIAHGPIRVLATADEDSGMLGAQALYNERTTKPVLSKMGKDFKGKDIKYLLNIDCEDIGWIVRSCTGSISYVWSNNFSPSIENKLSNNIYIDIKGFKGGHSGMDVVKDRANADKCIFEILKAINDSGKDIQLVKNYHPEDGKDISFERNQIVNHAKVAFNTNMQINEISSLIDTLTNTWKTFYKGEDWSKVKISVDNDTELDHSKFLSKQDSTNIISMVGKNTVPETSQNEKSIWYGYVSDSKGGYTISANIAPFEIGFDQSTNKIKFELASQTRVTDHDDQLPHYNLIKNYYEDITIGDIAHKIVTDYKPWIAKQDNKMVNWCKESFEKQGIQVSIQDDTPGIEPSWWQQCNPNLHCTSIGPTITGAHSVKETLKIDTIQPIFEVCKYVFEKMKA